MDLPDQTVAHIAATQHGIATRLQLVGAGMTRSAIEHRLMTGRLHRLHRSVYAVGHPAVTDHGRLLAAVLACGAGSVLSHRSAAELWELLPRTPGPVHVTRSLTRRRSPSGVALHHRRTLPTHDVVTHHGIPVTSARRTLKDLERLLANRDLDRAIEQAQVHRLVRPHDLLSPESSFTRSEAERRLLDLIDRADLPRPRTNARVGRFEVDAHWPAERLVVEVDGYAFHATRAAFERDRLRDATLQAAGLRVVRVTWLQLDRSPEAVVARLARLLAA